MTFNVTDLSTRIGSEVETRREELLAGDHSARIRELLELRGVLVFHGIDFSDEEMQQFALTMGAIQGGETYAGSVFKVTFDADHNPHGETYLMGAQEWHIDRTDIDTPPLGSMLTPRVLAKVGGQTDFANTYAAYEDLPEEEKRFLEGLEVEHRVEDPIRRRTENPTEEQIKAWQAKEPKIHPLVWQHRSGRRSLVLGGTASRIVGMDKAESDSLLARLMEWSEKPEYTYRHEWTMGDFVIWDNTGTMHRMVPFDKASGRRLHRITLVGEEPIRAVA